MFALIIFALFIFVCSINLMLKYFQVEHKHSSLCKKLHFPLPACSAAYIKVFSSVCQGPLPIFTSKRESELRTKLHPFYQPHSGARCAQGKMRPNAVDFLIFFSGRVTHKSRSGPPIKLLFALLLKSRHSSVHPEYRGRFRSVTKSRTYVTKQTDRAN